MSFVSDLRGVSEAAVSQLTERFGDLPRPLLAAIGAGDFAVERLAELRDVLAESLGRSAASGAGEARDFAADLPVKVQEAAGEVIESVQKFTADVPVRTQRLVEQLPERLADIREALSPEQLRGAVEGYTQLAGVIYGSLAERGDKKWAAVAREPAAAAVATPPVATPVRPTVTSPVTKPAAATSTPKPAAPKVTKAPAPKPAAPKATRTTTPKPVTAKPTPVTAKPTPVIPKRPSTSSVKPATKPAPARPTVRPTPKPVPPAGPHTSDASN